MKNVSLRQLRVFASVAKHLSFARAAEELNSLPDGSVIAEMLSDYAVLRDQTRSCSR